MSQIQQPHPTRALDNPRKKARSNLDSFGPSSSLSPSSSSTLGNSSLGSPLDFDGWQKPSKFAYWCSPQEEESGLVRVKSAEFGKHFPLLFESGSSEAMELGCDLGPSPNDFYMANISELKLKWARSPPKLNLSPMAACGFDSSLLQEGEADLTEE